MKRRDLSIIAGDNRGMPHAMWLWMAVHAKSKCKEKNMRYPLVITALILAVVIASPLSAADKRATTSGVYLTADDFARGALTSEDERGSSHKMLLHDSIFGKSYIEVIHNGEARRYEKNEIWGFRDFDGKSYRFVDKEAYEVREAEKLVIYTKEEFATGRKGRTEPAYYFSVGVAGSVVPLTATNLKTAFPENHRFHDYLDMMIGDVTQFDKFHNVYKVNHLLISSETSDR